MLSWGDLTLQRNRRASSEEISDQRRFSALHLKSPLHRWPHGSHAKICRTTPLLLFQEQRMTAVALLKEKHK
jgi:hypothetical protein